MMFEKQMISIVIPAHNEAEVIACCLQQLVQDSDTLSLEIIVVCNGCSDNTAEVVRSFEQVMCVETDTASKPHALNLGDKEASYFPRFYLDADIRLSLGDIATVVAAMADDGVLAAAPKVQMDLTGSSWMVRSYYDIWCNLPYCREGMIGAGVYVLSEAGRARFVDFPDVLSDDIFIRDLFTTEERLGVTGAVSIITAPTSLGGLIKIKTRGRLGLYELKARFPELMKNEGKTYGLALKQLMGKVNLWPKVLVYLGINIVTRMRARQQSKTKGFAHWERDESSRKKIKAKHD